MLDDTKILNKLFFTELENQLRFLDRMITGCSYIITLLHACFPYLAVHLDICTCLDSLRLVNDMCESVTMATHSALCVTQLFKVQQVQKNKTGQLIYIYC